MRNAALWPQFTQILELLLQQSWWPRYTASDLWENYRNHKEWGPAWVWGTGQGALYFAFLFIYFWLHWVLTAGQASFVVARGCCSLAVVLIAVASLVAEHGGFGSCGVWAQRLHLPGPRAQAQYLRLTGSVASWHMGPSWVRDRTHISCIFFTTEPPGKS